MGLGASSNGNPTGETKREVEFIGGKYAGTYTFERSKKSKDGQVWWMRKSRPVRE